MEIKKLDNQTTVFIYDEIEEMKTNVFLIEKETSLYLIDTFCGSESMLPVLDEIDMILGDKELYIVNTHFHWDHVWGNCSFNGCKIISHEKCRQLLEKTWDKQIKENKKYILGNIEKCLPNIIFKENLYFPKDNIEIFYSPGHTIDSISIFDHSTGILYVGDNLEKPIVYVESEEIDTYIQTLKKYLGYSPKKMMAGHTLDLDERNLVNTINYLFDLKLGKEMHFKTKYERDIHSENLKVINSKHKPPV